MRTDRFAAELLTQQIAEIARDATLALSRRELPEHLFSTDGFHFGPYLSH